MKRVITLALVLAIGAAAAAQMSSPPVTGEMRFSSPHTVKLTITSDGRVIIPEDAQAQQITVTVSAAQIAALRARWPEPTQIGLPAGTPATAQQLIQAFIDFGLASDVARIREDLRQRRLKELSADECQKVADTLKLPVTDLPCGGGR